MKPILLFKSLFFLGVIGLIVGTAPQAQAFASYVITGHEHITYFALEQLQASQDPLTQIFYGTALGAIDYRAHPLFYGNIIVDFPQLDRAFAENLMPLLMGEVWANLSPAERQTSLDEVIIHEHHRSQIMNFTRNYLDENHTAATSAKESCLQSHDFIKNTVMAALDRLAGQESRTERKKNGLQFIGAALHTIQDSFSPAHTHRDRHNLTIQDICTYQTPYFGRNGQTSYSVACLHTFFPVEPDFGGGSVFADEQVWDRSQQGCQLTENGMIQPSFNCLNAEAQLAAIVTRDFLEMLLPFANQALQHREVSYPDLEIALDAFLNAYHPDPAVSPQQGILSCDSLADFHPHTPFKIDQPLDQQ